MSNTRGKFITVEGQDGAGKSTNIAFVHQLLEQRGIDVLLTREPGGTKLGEELRRLILDGHEYNIDATAELLLIFAARAQHLKETITPALNQGSWVLCDRFTDATFAYQGGGRGLPMGHVQQLQTLVQAGLQPDLTLLLDVDINTGLSRARQRAAHQPDRFEGEQILFKTRVRKTYLQLAEQHADRIQVVDASVDIAQVQHQIQCIIDTYLNQHP